MYIRNIHDFPDIPLYKCSFEEYFNLLKIGFTPIFIDNGFYFFILDDKLKTEIKKTGGEDC